MSETGNGGSAGEGRAAAISGQMAGAAAQPVQDTAAEQREAAARRFGALRHRNFVLFWAGLLTSNTGTWMALVAQGFLIYEITGSKAMLGMVGLARAIPMVLFPLWGGVVADRVDRIRLLWFTQVLMALSALALGVLVTTGLIQPWHIVAASFITAVMGAFDQPARLALLPNLVPKQDLLSATSLNSVVFTGAAFTGPALYGMVAPFIGTDGAFYVNAASFGAFLLALTLIRLPERSVGAARGNALQAMREGLRYISASTTLRSLIILAAVSSFFGSSYRILLPAVVQDVLAPDLGEQAQLILQSYLTSAAGAGTLVGAFGLAGLASGWRKGPLLFGSALAFTVLYLLFTITPVYGLSLVLTVGLGLTNTVFAATTSTLLQVLSPGNLRGRVMSLYTLCFLGFGPLGAGVLGPLAELLGIQGALFLGAVVIGITVVSVGLLQPQMRHLE